MIDKIVNLFLQHQLNMESIQKEDVSVYRYGYTLMLEGIVNMFVALLIAILLEEVKVFFCFFLLFMPLRSFCGGYHAKKAWQCVVLSNTVVVLASILSKQLEFSNIVAVVLEIICFLVIFIFSPVESKNKKLSEKEKKYYKIYAIGILVFEIILESIFFIVQWKRLVYLVVLVHLIQAVSLVAAVLENRE